MSLWSWESSGAENNRRAELPWGQESQESLLRSVLSHQEMLEGLQPWDYSGLFTAWSRRRSYNSFYSHLFGMDVNKSWKENTGKHIHSPRCQSTKRLSVCVCVYKQMHDKNKRENLRPSSDSLKIYFHGKGDFTELFPCMCVEFPRTLCCINTSFPIQSDPRKPRPINPLPMPWTCTAIQNLHIHSMNVPLLKHRGHMAHIPRIAKRRLISIISQGEEIRLHKTQ